MPKLRFQLAVCLCLVMFGLPVAAEAPKVDYLYKGLKVGDFARSERLAATRDVRQWAAHTNGRVFDLAGFSKLKWPADAAWLTYIMNGTVPQIFNMEKEWFSVLYFNAFLDVGVFTKYRGNYETPDQSVLEDMFVVPGEVLRDKFPVGRQQAWRRSKDIFIISIPELSKQTLSSATRFHTTISDYYSYYKLRVEQLSSEEKHNLELRLADSIYLATQESVPCSSTLTEAKNHFSEAVEKIDSGFFKGKGAEVKILLPLYIVSKFPVGEDDAFAIYEGQLADVQILIRAKKINGVCQIYEIIPFDPNANFYKDYLSQKATDQPAPSSSSVNLQSMVPIKGAPKVVSTSQIMIGSQSLQLEGVAGLTGAAADKLSSFIKEQGGEVTCRKGTALDRYRCKTATSIDLSAAVLLNGSGRLAESAPDDLRAFEAQARSHRVGIWATSSN